MSKTYSVYVHTCPNGKKYVGITANTPEQRWNDGYGYYHNTHFYRAIKKFGWDNIIHEVVASGLNESTAIAMEVELIAKHNSMNPKHGYNNTTGGEVGKEYSEEIKKKMSENRKGIHAGESHHCYGKSQAEIFGEEQTRQNIEVARLRWSSDENPQKKNPRRGENHPLFGKKFSKEYRMKIAKGRTNQKLSPENAVEIMRLYYESDMDMFQLANKFGISRQSVGDVVHRRIYAYATESLDYPTNKIIRKRVNNG